MIKTKIIKYIQIKFDIETLIKFGKIFREYYRINKRNNEQFVLSLKWHNTILSADENDYIVLISENKERTLISINEEEFKKLQKEN